jgi:hypothetical protein
MRFHRANVRFRRRYIVIPLLLIVLGAVLAVRSSTMTQSTPQHAQGVTSPPPSPQCRSGDPLAGVYNPLRFRVLSKCEVASGVVESVALQDGGDQRISVRLDAQYANLLDVGNSSNQYRLLVLELIPQDQATVPVPSIGQHIMFVGPLVYDTENHWNGISPVWSIQAD